MACLAICAAGPPGRTNPKRVCFRWGASALDPEGVNPGVLLEPKLENLVFVLMTRRRDETVGKGGEILNLRWVKPDTLQSRKEDNESSL